MTTTDADKLMARVARMTDAEVLDAFKMARNQGHDRTIVHMLAAEAKCRGILILAVIAR
jgi:hypothetical protein